MIIEKLITTPEDDYDKMIYDLHNGKEKGTTTYMDFYDNCWTWKPGTFNIISGYNNEGKGQWLRHICLIKALEENKRFAFYAPEDYPSSELYDDLIHTITGKSTDKDNPNFITDDEYNEAFNLIRDKFYFLYIKPPHNTLSEILQSFNDLIESDENMYGFIIDPHIKVTRDKNAPDRDDLHGAYFTGLLGDFSRMNNVLTFLVMHQNTPSKIEGTGLYPEPDGYKVKQGGSYIDTADSLHIVWRPLYAKDKLNPLVTVGTKKVKFQKLVGIPQTFDISFDRKTNRYVDKDTGKPLYNYDKWMKGYKKKINF